MQRSSAVFSSITGCCLVLAIGSFAGCGKTTRVGEVGADSTGGESSVAIEMHPFQVGDDFVAPRSGRDPDTLPPPIDFSEGTVTREGTAYYVK